ncbi:cytochrome b5 reductase [Aspergillus luchuensis]|uniref:Cytochrome b5 reductase n=1 Tax=Aspergillus kawachii TaxID=1069201 RepID=A0A146FYM8_ASPKA|nr:cytochrome b5 reductase [Aspergillus luchuensis]
MGADSQLAEYTLADVAKHNRKDDIWIAIHGQVFDITEYLQDHPGGVDVLLETAGTDATADFEDVGHSEDSREILQDYLIGTLKDAKKFVPPKAVRVISQKPEKTENPATNEYQRLPLIQKDLLSPNVYRFVFALPDTKGVIGLPIGQHVAIRAIIDGNTVSRSYTPVSNNLDLGRLELVVKCYPDGLLSGKYLANLNVGDEVEFRGPKGAMRYSRGLCAKIGMVAGGTGITPMYQLIRAICEDERDTTEISLIYANRSEGDILLREELEEFARKYPKNFKLWYMLDAAPEGWTYGSGYVNETVLRERLPIPSAETKVMLCGPPGMVNACKKTLGAIGFQTSGTISKMSDQIFCF